MGGFCFFVGYRNKILSTALYMYCITGSILYNQDSENNQ